MSRQIWWYFQGTHWNTGKAINQLSHYGDRLVIASNKAFYLKLQTSDTAFAEGLERTYYLTKRKVGPPIDYGITPCGMWWIRPLRHSRNCRSCQRLKRNAALLTGVVIPESGLFGLSREDRAKVWDYAVDVATTNLGKEATETHVAKRQPKAPEGRYPHESTGHAAEEAFINQALLAPTLHEALNTEETQQAYDAAMAKAAVLFEEAVYWEGIAAQYQALLAPTPGVVEAQQALDLALSKAAAERTQQQEALRITLKQAPEKRNGLAPLKGVIPAMLKVLKN